MTPVLRALLPGATVLAAAFAVLYGTDEATAGELASTYGLVVYGAGVVLSWVFHRSRAFIALGVLAWLDLAVVGRPDRAELLVPLGTVVLLALAVLAVVRDRGPLSRVGAAQALAIATLVSALGIALADPTRAAPVLARPEWLPLRAVVWPGFPRITLLVAGVALLSALWGALRYRGPVERALLWTVLLVLGVMHPATGGAAAAVLLVAAGMMLTVGIVETSYVMAYRDELTGLPGRRALMQALDGIGGTYTLAMVDVDHFKKFNDRHGHDVGDQVLKLVATKLARAPGGAKAYRYGGEEFTLLLPGRVRDDALEHLEAVRRSVDEARFSVRSWRRPRRKPAAPNSESTSAKSKSSKARSSKGKPRTPRKLSVTVSIGVADTAVAGPEPEAVLKKADQALYRAKKKGRNQVSK